MSVDDEEGPLRPGFASAEPDDEPAEPLPHDMARAHYDGHDEEGSRRTWAAETLCAGCLHLPVCSHVRGAEETLIVITRCLAYLPRAG